MSMTDEIILAPIITEKSSAQIANDKYHFFVATDANKIEIRKFIEKKFKVSVDKVNLVKVVSKKKRRGKYVGKTAQRKKAIVTLKAGSVIETVKEMF
ncbi:50S ribosomal protein L23 [bacterium]|jgi:large subunit ribosomal protein L23|nr:50S ribosomal protein L23 [bacterium]